MAISRLIVFASQSSLTIQLAIHFFHLLLMNFWTVDLKKLEPIFWDEPQDHSNTTYGASEFVRAFIL